MCISLVHLNHSELLGAVWNNVRPKRLHSDWLILMITVSPVDDNNKTAPQSANQNFANVRRCTRKDPHAERLKILAEKVKPTKYRVIQAMRDV